MFNSISTFTHEVIPFIQEKTALSLTDRQKKILIIAALAFGCLAALYAAYHYYKSRTKDNAPAGNVSMGHTPLSRPYDTPLENAMDLMFEDGRRLEFGVFFPSLSDKEKTERYEKLKSYIEKLSVIEVNKTIDYRDGMMTRTQTLLIQAIQNIQDPARRFGIVKLLLEKGASPNLEGLYYEPISPMKEAQEKNDEQLISLLDAALREKNGQPRNGKFVLIQGKWHADQSG